MATVLSGARAKLIVNGVEVGYASNVSATENIALARVRYKQGDELTFLQNWGSTVSIGAEYIY